MVPPRGMTTAEFQDRLRKRRAASITGPRSKYTAPTPSKCIHLGEIVESAPCGCSKKHVRDCAIHDKCTFGPSRVTQCPCPDFDAGFVDPHPTPINRPHDWHTKPETIREYVNGAKAYMDSLPPYPGNRSGAGYILCGGARYDTGNYVSIRMLRHFSGDDIPVQVWHRGDEQEPVSDMVRALPNVTVIDAETHPLRPSWRSMGGWQIKMLAGLHSGFERWIFSDADNYPVADVRPMLEALKETPAILFPDIPGADGGCKWRFYGVPSDNGPGINGGSSAYNLPMAWKACHLAHWYDMHDEYFYKAGYGDQDQVRAAFQVSKTPFRLASPRPGGDGRTFVQDFDGKPLFVHRIHGKPCVGREFGKMTARRSFLPQEDLFWHYLNEYREAARPMNGTGSRRVFVPPPPPVTVDVPSVDAFTEVYRNGIWGQPWRSGGGSIGEEAEEYVKLLSEWMKGKPIRRVLDIGAGDGHVIGEISKRMPGIQFEAVDCVPRVVEEAKKRAPSVTWHLSDLLEYPIPPGFDLILCKDVLHHLPNNDVAVILEKLRTSGTQCLIVADFNGAREENDCARGKYRPLDFTYPEWLPYRIQKIRRYLHKCIWSMNV
jgi:SAM-dependent methyltransferase